MLIQHVPMKYIKGCGLHFTREGWKMEKTVVNEDKHKQFC